MDFDSGFRVLANGRAIKRPSWRGYVERVKVADAETLDVWLASQSYTVGNKVNYNGSGYICTADSAAGTLPTDTSYWEAYTPVAEKYDIVFHKADGTTTHSFKYPESESGSAEDLILDRELLTHITAMDWIEGSAADFAQALNATEESDW